MSGFNRCKSGKFLSVKVKPTNTLFVFDAVIRASGKRIAFRINPTQAKRIAFALLKATR